jgi:hypothetical protein
VKAGSLRFNLTLFLTTFGGLTVLAAVGFDFVERLIVMVVVVLLYRVALVLLDARARDD